MIGLEYCQNTQTSSRIKCSPITNIYTTSTCWRDTLLSQQLVISYQQTLLDRATLKIQMHLILTNTARKIGNTIKHPLNYSSAIHDKHPNNSWR